MAKITPKEDMASVSFETPLLDEQLAATTLGTYAPNHAIIRLSQDASFWLEENEPTLDRLAVFVHEYAHYLHNFSTTSGIYGFVATLRLLALFINTVDETGKSLGASALSAEASRELAAIVDWRLHLSGSYSQPFDMARMAQTELQVVDVSRHAATIDLSVQTLSIHRVSITLAKASDPTIAGSFFLGTHVLMEGLAWEIERILFASQGADSGMLDSRFPTWPYKAPRAIFESIAKHSLSPEQMAQVVLLSLLNTDPGDAFIAIADIFLGNALSESPDQIIERLRDVTLKELNSIKSAMIKSLTIETDRFSSKPTIHRGLKAMMKWAIEFLEVRSGDAFFELNTIRAADRDDLVEMFKKFPPCPIIQETGPHSQDLELFFIADRDPDHQIVNDLGVTQSLLHFASAHTNMRGIVPTPQAREGLCTFSGVCKLPLTVSSPEVCRRRPWESFAPQEGTGCWYASGVRLARSVKSNSSQ
ncbi:hypothetical protein [Limnobacter sp.]|uniref:hypothetical protein n=1 Tax=Limnobacter sp. TaxID=2003368 RepID=UPI0027341A87|nr:hypothetical protein [Limnobacter sp.]MDP3271258.1 hypothetical protein [Limnobacter sp.]